MEPKWTDELRIYGEGFVGRKAELAAMDRAWREGARIFALHAEGGAGKTRVVFEWLVRMRDAGWPGAQRVFVHSFYSQGSDDRRNASSELFFEQALAYFGHEGAPILQADEKGRALARLLVEHHGLLVLDGLEPLQHPTHHTEKGQLKDPGIRRLLLSLANVSGGMPGLCLITSRQPVVEIEGRLGATVRQQSLDHLHRDDGAALLRQFEVVGPDEELKKASDEFHGHAYSLMLLGSYLKTATDHYDIRRRNEVVLLEEDAEHRSHARKMFAAYVRHLGEDSPEVAVLRLLGFFDRATEHRLLDVLKAPEGVVYEWSEKDTLARQRREGMRQLGLKADEPADERPNRLHIRDSLADVTSSLLGLGRALPRRSLLQKLLYHPCRWWRSRQQSAVMSDATWLRVLDRLRYLRLIDLSGSGTSSAVDTHPLLREYFAEQIQKEFPAAWKDGHRRLFEYIGGTVPYWPEGIEGLQPLYRAVVHGCLAELHQQAWKSIYRDRILRGTTDDGFYSTRKLGTIGADLGAVTCFFEKRWTTFATDFAPADGAWLVSEAAFRLRALGRLTEAVEPMLAGMEIHVELFDWGSAAQAAESLSELELTRGEVFAAITAGERAVAFADRSGIVLRKLSAHAVLADALHQSGHKAKSRRLFEGAEILQVETPQEYPRLYSLPGIKYCDLLLADVDREMWQRRLLGMSSGLGETVTATCNTVSERAAYAIKIAEHSRWLLDIALNHLILARTNLYMTQGSSQPPQCALDHITAAVDGLRAAGTMHYLPHGLLTRAWIRLLSDDEAGSRADLDEAWEISERGPMPLFQADIHLYRARLFRDRTALAEARRLIEKHGYHRRDGELADAEAAAAAADGPLPWPLPRGAGEGDPSPKVSTEPVIREASMRDKVFISYCHRDAKLMEELLTQLKPYLRTQVVTAWSDKQIASGAQWRQEIEDALERTGVAVLLVSPDFLASEFIHEHELGPLLKEAETGGVKILWIPLRPSAFEETPLAAYQAVSPPNEPLSQMKRKADREAAWVRICKEIKAAINR